MTDNEDEEALPYETVVPYETVDVEASFVVQVIVAVVRLVEDATEEMTGAVVSATTVVNV